MNDYGYRDKRIESMGEMLTPEQRRAAGIDECVRTIERATERLKVLIAEGRDA